MASGSVDMEEETNCSICIECLKDPVTVDCGHNFCRACITSYCEEQEGIRDLECPLCKLRIQKETFRSNWQLANIIEKIKFLAPNLRKEDLCAKHHEKLNLFCEEDTALICVICERAPEHKAHHVVLKEEAAQKYKDEIWNCLEALRKETEKIQAYRTDVEKESQNFLDETKSTREKTVAIFKEIRLFLEEQEKVLLGRIEEVEKDIAKKKDEHLAKLSEELSSLGELILEMEKKHQQSASELLQDIKRTLKSVKERKNFENTVVFPAELKWEIVDICDIHLILGDVNRQIKDAVLSGDQLKKENITMDPNRADQRYIVSTDLKSTTPIRDSRLWRFILGHQEFISGRHFWEVTVGNEGDWAVGLARKSLWREDYVLCDPEGVWAIWKSEGKYWLQLLSYRRSGPTYLPPSFTPSKDPKRIRVSLNCTHKQVAFYNADTGDHLYTFSGVSFEGDTLVPFFSIGLNGHLRISP